MSCGPIIDRTDLTNKHIGVEKEEYWHIGGDGEGAAGPFDTIEDAKADAIEVLHSSRYHVPEVVIVKAVARSKTRVSYATEWKDQ